MTATFDLSTRTTNLVATLNDDSSVYDSITIDDIDKAKELVAYMTSVGVRSKLTTNFMLLV